MNFLGDAILGIGYGVTKGFLSAVPMDEQARRAANASVDAGFAGAAALTGSVGMAIGAGISAANTGAQAGAEAAGADTSQLGFRMMDVAGQASSSLFSGGVSVNAIATSSVQAASGMGSAVAQEMGEEELAAGLGFANNLVATDSDTLVRKAAGTAVGGAAGAAVEAGTEDDSEAVSVLQAARTGASFGTAVSSQVADGVDGSLKKAEKAAEAPVSKPEAAPGATSSEPADEQVKQAGKEPEEAPGATSSEPANEQVKQTATQRSSTLRVPGDEQIPASDRARLMKMAARNARSESIFVEDRPTSPAEASKKPELAPSDKAGTSKPKEGSGSSKPSAEESTRSAMERHYAKLVERYNRGEELGTTTEHIVTGLADSVIQLGGAAAVGLIAKSSGGKMSAMDAVGAASGLSVVQSAKGVVSAKKNLDTRNALAKALPSKQFDDAATAAREGLARSSIIMAKSISSKMLSMKSSVDRSMAQSVSDTIEQLQEEYESLAPGSPRAIEIEERLDLLRGKIEALNEDARIMSDLAAENELGAILSRDRTQKEEKKEKEKREDTKPKV